jgi:ArsR family transcriptional regulator
MFMQGILNLLKLLSDKSRLRTLLLLMKKELCVCQLIEILRLSQPLVSRNLNLMHRAGLIEARREGKLVFYSLKKGLPEEYLMILRVIEESLQGKIDIKSDLKNLKRCEEFINSVGRCDVKLFRAFMRGKKKAATVAVNLK